jgi:glycosyltransferase involved in cell wall biosynthesis
VGGVETHLLSLMRRCDPTRWRWRVLAETSDSFAELARAAGAAVETWRMSSAIDVRAASALTRRLRGSGVDVLHVHHPRALWPARLAGARMGVPVVYTVHLPVRSADIGGRGGGVRAGLHHLAEKAILQLTPPARVIHVSARAGDRQGDHARVVVIRNGADLSGPGGLPPRDALRRDLGASPSDVVVLTVARLVEQKGLDVLLEALARVEAPVHLWMCGDGPLRGALQEQAQRLSKRHAVLFLGAREDVRALLQAADLFVLPSRRETTPFALLEAMAAGRAAVATDVGDCADLLADGAGWVVPPSDEAALAAALSRLVTEPAARDALGARASSRVAAFTDVEMAARTSELYEAVIAERTPVGTGPLRREVPSAR